MNISRQRQLLDGQSSVARKVFEGVPIQEAWDEFAIIKNLRGSGGVTIASHAARSCLYDLKDAGLIKEPRKGHFTRTPVAVKEPRAIKSAESAESASFPNDEATMACTLTRHQAPQTPLDVLGTIAIDLTVFSTEFTARMKALSERVEDVALLVEAQREADAATMAKANQLQSLIKEMAGQL